MRESNAVLRAIVKELKSRSDQEAVAEVESQVGELQSKVDRVKAELEISEQQCKGLEQEVSTACAGLQEVQDDRARLEEEVLSMTEVATLLQYRVALECFRVKYPDLGVEENSFAELLEDANVKMDLC
ncbi:hypothetical protein BHE74_00017582 [Ensete ventricosum]|nr:hypothetical protein BHE74_00017582 [Ensete ventricosum]